MTFARLPMIKWLASAAGRALDREIPYPMPALLSPIPERGELSAAPDTAVRLSRITQR